MPPGILATLLPEDVVPAELFGEADELAVMPEETLALGTVAERRYQDFARGRTCARRALLFFGCGTRPVLIGSKREPLWPDGFIGSITHCPGYCAAAVAPANKYASIGIDAEPHAPLPDGVLGFVCLPEERTWLETSAQPAICWDRVLFSVKESVYKAWFPLFRKWLNFHTVLVRFASEPGRFTAEVSGGEPIRVLQGRFTVVRGFIATAVVIRHISDTHS